LLTPIQLAIPKSNSVREVFRICIKERRGKSPLPFGSYCNRIGKEMREGTYHKRWVPIRKTDDLAFDPFHPRGRNHTPTGQLALKNNNGGFVLCKLPGSLSS
jgi:hypothetical protein